MKKLLILLAVILLAALMNFTVFADDDYYSDIYEQSGADDLKYSLPDEARQFFDERNIDISDYNWVNSLKTENIFSHIFSFLKSGGRAPFKAGFTLIGIILATAAVRAFWSGKDIDAAIKFAITLAACGVLIYGIWGSINTAVNAIKGTGTFMLAFVPVYMGIVSVSGAPVSAAASGGMLLAAAEFVSSTAAFFITSLMGADLGLSISAGVSPLKSGGFAEVLKKTGVWFMTLCTTVFLGLLGVKNAVNSAVDSLSLRTAKFIIGTCVPVVGTALSGAVNTVSTSLSVMKSSVGVYGVVALSLLILPVVA